MDFTLCDLSFGHGIVNMLLSVQCKSLPIQAKSNTCKLVNIY
jgi:hypothetical protein